MAQRREPGRQQRAFQDLLDPDYQTFLDEDQTQGPRAHLSKRQWKKNKAKVKGETRGFKLKETGSPGWKLLQGTLRCVVRDTNQLVAVILAHRQPGSVST